MTVKLKDYPSIIRNAIANSPANEAYIIVPEINGVLVAAAAISPSFTDVQYYYQLFINGNRIFNIQPWMLDSDSGLTSLETELIVAVIAHLRNQFEQICRNHIRELSNNPAAICLINDTTYAINHHSAAGLVIGEGVCDGEIVYRFADENMGAVINDMERAIRREVHCAVLEGAIDLDLSELGQKTKSDSEMSYQSTSSKHNLTRCQNR